jgi:hypothetical protein
MIKNKVLHIDTLVILLAIQLHTHKNTQVLFYSMLLFHYLKVLFKVSIFLILFPPPVFSLFQMGKTNPQVSLGRRSSEVGFEDTDGVKNVEVVG